MREIKFRGKPKQTGGIKPSLAWTYGDLVQKNEKKYIAPSHNRVKIENDLARLMILIEVDPKTVGQYTGLQDRNGKDIYEGDMIFHYDQNCIIEYDSSAFVLKGLHKDKYKRAYAHLAHYLIDVTIPEVDGSKYDGVTTKLEVIGNRFDNPELLGEVRE